MTWQTAAAHLGGAVSVLGGRLCFSHHDRLGDLHVRMLLLGFLYGYCQSLGGKGKSSDFFLIQSSVRQPQPVKGFWGTKFITFHIFCSILAFVVFFRWGESTKVVLTVWRRSCFRPRISILVIKRTKIDAKSKSCSENVDLFEWFVPSKQAYKNNLYKYIYTVENRMGRIKLSWPSH